ncbi:dipeptide/oligopeptide/nickel ABC transporter ATP-binding protein [Chloroflexi bacterium TSY]|nr:dipeptide/oligopeptide/nickel ABC transporter ATP-binding protein [Chloroflexi bacterium TSY]
MSLVEKAKTDNAQRDNVLEITGLRKHFPIIRGFFRRTEGYVNAVDGINFHVVRGETLALVGESGCGKTTTGRCVMRAIEPTSGRILFRKRDGEEINMTELDRVTLRSTQRHMGMIFQDPFSSLNPRMTVLEIIGEPFVTRKLVKNRRELEDRVARLLRSVRLDPTYMRRYPHAFSGGQRQRIAIARALALDPDFVVADEPVSALDVSVQAQILSLSRSKFGVFGDFQSRLQGFWSHLFRFRLQKTTYFISENRPNLTQKLDIDRQICIYVNCLARILSQNLKFGSTESTARAAS